MIVTQEVVTFKVPSVKKKEIKIWIINNSSITGIKSMQMFCQKAIDLMLHKCTTEIK